MTFTTLHLTVHDGLAEIVLDQPDNGNAFGDTFCAEFGALGTELSARRDVRAVLLRARGPYFSVGGDLEMFSRDLDAAPRTVLAGTYGLHMGLARLLRMDAPIVACAHATAMGGALAIVANCDLVYGARSASFGAAYGRLGFSCDLGATQGLASRMGVARARRLLLLNETLTADEALDAGLVDFVTADDQVEDAARAAAVRLSHGPTRAYGEVRRLVRRALAVPFETVLEDEAQVLAGLAATADAREGITAFTHKRQPHFDGR